VYAATDAGVHRAVSDEARAAGVWVNVADEAPGCDFFAPATVRRGDLTIAISTNGASPALARRIREWLDVQFGADYETALGELRALRDEARATGRPIAELGARFDAIIDRLLP
jgi:precorrin-2 dehydrogenase/sirohydrochlorin ferrochelatase